MSWLEASGCVVGAAICTFGALVGIASVEKAAKEQREQANAEQPAELLQRDQVLAG